MGPSGLIARPVKLASSRNRVLRGEGRPTLRSVDRGFIGRVIEPRKNLSAKADAVQWSEGSTRGPKWPGLRVSPGSKSRACGHGGPPGTWEIQVSPPTQRGWGSHDPNNPGPGWSADAHGRNEQWALGWYRQTKATKCGGRGIGKSEQLVLALKAGNRSAGPAGAKGLPDHGTVGGKDDGSIRSRKRLDETTTDSRAGPADAGEGHDLAVPAHGH